MAVPPPPTALPAAPAALTFSRPTRFERVLAGFVATVGCVAFMIAAVIEPYDSSGSPLVHGTHQQLGLPPCTLLSICGFPCPSCGMTTSISLLVHGDLAAAWRANCAGTFLGGAGLVAMLWLALLAAGVPRWHHFSAESTILTLTVAAATAAAIRYAALIGAALAGG